MSLSLPLKASGSKKYQQSMAYMKTVYRRIHTHYLRHRLSRPLQGRRVRLLKIAPDLRDGLIDCTLFYGSLDDEFFALSYVWGDPNDTMSIYINGDEFQLTKNLHKALDRFRGPDTNGDDDTCTPEANPYQKKWWIDAVCINQDDAEERVREVLRMGEIYSSADKIWVWLGLEDGADQTGARRLFKLGRGFEEAIDEEYDGREAQDHELPFVQRFRMAAETVFLTRHQAPGQLREVFSQVMNHPWFSRIWTFQEHVLVRDEGSLYYDVGDSIRQSDFAMLILAFASTTSISEEKNQVKLLVSGLSNLSEAHDQHVDRVHNCRHLADCGPNDTDSMRSQVADDLRLFLGLSTGRRATIPHDRIYGLLGLVETTWLPPRLKPDYNADFRRVYQDYSRFVMETTGYLDMLHCRRDVAAFVGFPSWVPDFEADAKWAAHRIDGQNPATRGPVSFSEDGQVLTVQGCILDTIPIDLSMSHVRGVSDDDQLLDTYLDMFRTIFLPAARRRGGTVTSSDVFKEWLQANGEALQNLVDVLGLSDDITELGSLFEQCPEDASHAIGQHPIWTRNLKLFRLLCFHSHILCVGGTIVRLVEEPADFGCFGGGVLCSLKGACTATILQPTSGPEGHYTLVGSCIVLTGRKETLDDEYFERREITDFHIH